MAQDAKPEKPRDYTFVFITTGPKTDLTPDEQKEAMTGHFANMKRLFDESKLLIAGPLGPPKSDPAHRGLFVLDETDLGRGLALAETDPAFRMGVFVMTAHTLTTSAPLTDLLELDRAALEKLGDNPSPAANARSYVLASAAYDETLLAKAEVAEGVLIAARLHGSGPEGADQILLWLDAENEEAAKAITDAIGGEWTLHGWFGSKSVAELAD